ncbi:hypothetical protein, partial [Ferrimicrobium acidiphilum]|uniref:hypothetical protein n=1 Tax=Ferrimicrobium acidiphilum TaxID=121039 RepID=UPI003C6CDB44
DAQRCWPSESPTACGIRLVAKGEGDVTVRYSARDMDIESSAGGPTAVRHDRGSCMLNFQDTPLDFAQRSLPHNSQLSTGTQVLVTRRSLTLFLTA